MLTKKLQRYGEFGTHDALKLIALLSMFADHAGAFYFPDCVGLRVAGRLAAPIFFFLIGYTRSYRLHADLLVAAAFMVGLAAFHTHSLMHLNILASFVLVRGFFLLAEKHPRLLAWPWVLVGIFAPLGFLTLDYIAFGTIGWLFALLGYVQKNRDGFGAYSRFLMFFVTFYLWIFQHIIQLHLLAGGAFALTLLLSACAVMLWFYRPRTLTLPQPVRALEPAIAWPARYSLWIYIAHLAALQIITGRYQ